MLNRKSNGPLQFAICNLQFAMLFAVLASRPAHAISINAGPVLIGNPVTSEMGLSNSVTVQVTLDSAGQAQVDFFEVSPVDSSLTRVATVTQLLNANTPTQIPWNALWPIAGTPDARH